MQQVQGTQHTKPVRVYVQPPLNPLHSLQEQLCQLYPRLKVLAFGAKPESTLHTYFPSFLSRATPSCPPEMKKEVRNWWEVPFFFLASVGRSLSADRLCHWEPVFSPLPPFPAWSQQQTAGSLMLHPQKNGAEKAACSDLTSLSWSLADK